MIFHNVLVLSFLFLICCFGLIKQHYYLITASISKIYCTILLISSLVTAVESHRLSKKIFTFFY